MIIYDGRSLQDQHSNNQLVLNIDLAPTILDYAGIIVPATMQGNSLRTLTEGQAPSWRTEFYYEHQYDTDGTKVYLPKSEGLVRLNYKYMRYYSGKDPDNFMYGELYNQLVDPFEVHNMSNSPDESALKEEMIKKMKQMRTGLR